MRSRVLASPAKAPARLRLITFAGTVSGKISSISTSMGKQKAGKQKKPAFQISKEARVAGTLPPSGKTSAPPVPLYEDLGPLPTEYGVTTLFLVARDPEWLFCYWELPSSAPGSYGLKVFGANHREVYFTPLTQEARNWYIPVTPGRWGDGQYYAEIGTLHPDGRWEPLIRSNETALLQSDVSNQIQDRFATIPFHLAFQEMLEVVKKNRNGSEPVVNTLSRLQEESRQLILALSRAPQWTPEQRNLLAALLGNELDDLLGLSTEEIDSLLRRQLNDRLGSEALGSRLEEGVDLSTLTSAGAASWITSWENADSFWSSWLSSWSHGSGGSESASWLTSWSSAARETFSSSLSSWPGAPSERESAFWSSWLSSWGVGLGGSSAFGSREMGSSWSAQPFGMPRSGRDFFMHVNAEVIFYGGTHPQAKLWVDGKPVPLQPDGSFHFHFKFPDGDYFIPIVAESPDGMEQRSATLRFTRQTSRQGDVGDTWQPSFPGEPFGRCG